MNLKSNVIIRTVRKNSNTIINTVTAIIVILVTAGIVFIVYNLLIYPTVPSRMDDFVLCIKEYTQAAEFYYKDFEKYNTDLLIYSVPYNENDNDIVCFTEEYKHEIIIDENERQFFSKVRDSYHLDKISLNHVLVYDGFVSFCNVNGRSSYVYSIYDKEPEYINSPKESKKDDLYIKKMSDNWYFVCKMSKIF